MPAIYHVAVTGDDRACGSQDAPFRTISRAAAIAAPGDTVRVHGGVYREWVDPLNGGVNSVTRITYEAAPGEHVVIKGSERVTGWQNTTGTVWKVVLPNAMFGGWNPYKEYVEGDWLISPTDPKVHTGDVYLNGMSMYEAFSVAEVEKAEKRLSGHQLPSNSVIEPILHPEQTIYQWYAEVGCDATTIWANFQGSDPNREEVEINVRKCCFYPTRTGVSYITVRGFEICHAACPWAPPTADQPGMLGPHWSRGWIMEDNELHDAKCSAISIGKEEATGHNLFSRFGRKPGYRYQMESVFLAVQSGWGKDKIGSHIIRRNLIHDCGQNAIVGHMGCVFSRIEHNHIFNIGVKREFFGYEIGGIKLHAAIDVVIENNNIHNCELGTWLDWQAQGTRITRNVYHHNDRDLMIEVTHGPCLVDNNIFASDYSFDNFAQGTAYVHNLVCGQMRRIKVLDRATPYHFPHTTEVAGCAVVYSGDDRFYNNLFTMQSELKLPVTGDKTFAGTAGYDDMTTPEEYWAKLAAEKHGDLTKFQAVEQPAYVAGNAYSGKADAFRAEADALCADGLKAEIVEENGVYELCMEVPASIATLAREPVTTARLGMPRITEELYENPDETPVDFTRDLLGAHRDGQVVPGPLAELTADKLCREVWRA